MFLKIFSQGFIFGKKAYLRSNWNKLDFLIVISSSFGVFFDSKYNLGGFRVIRILRPLRTISSIKNLRILLLTLFSAIPLLTDTVIILLFFFIIYAIAGLNLFSGQLKKRCFQKFSGIQNKTLFCGFVNCPGNLVCGKIIENPNWGYTNFDNIGYSLFQIFQCITLEGWSETNNMISKTFSPYSVFYFISSVVMGSYFILGITLAVIKAQFTETHEKIMKIQQNSSKTKKNLMLNYSFREYKKFLKGYMELKRNKKKDFFSQQSCIFSSDSFSNVNKSISMNEERNSVKIPNVLTVNLKKNLEKYLPLKINQKSNNFNFKQISFIENSNKNELLYSEDSLLKWPENLETNDEYKRIFKNFKHERNISSSFIRINSKKGNLKINVEHCHLQNNKVTNSFKQQKHLEIYLHDEKKKETDFFKENKNYKYFKNLPSDFIKLKINHNEKHKSESLNDVFPKMLIYFFFFAYFNFKNLLVNKENINK